jgi:hypothetical protein
MKKQKTKLTNTSKMAILALLVTTTVCKNFCKDTRCAECTKAGEYYSCTACYRSIHAEADVNTNDTVLKCISESTGISNCFIGENGIDTTKIGCKYCENGYYLQTQDKDGTPGTTVGICLKGYIDNCKLYTNIMEGDEVSC